jgi:Family of unknown function (DUF6221)
MTAGPWASFLAARLDEDEKLARQSLEEAQQAGERETRYPYPDRLAACMHDARHNPARVLREVEAKRAIVAAHPVRPIINGTCKTCSDREGLSWSSLEAGDPDFVDWPCFTLRALAAVWSDHPDYPGKNDPKEHTP